MIHTHRERGRERGGGGKGGKEREGGGETRAQSFDSCRLLYIMHNIVCMCIGQKLGWPPKLGIGCGSWNITHTHPPPLKIFRYDRKVEHYRVRRDDRAWVTVDDEEYFENLFKLVEVKYYSMPYLNDSSGLV